MLQHVYERALMSKYLTSTIIATDDDRVFAVAKKFGARVRMTHPDHASGTDRVAEVASAENAELIVNIQGDEPLIDPAAIDTAIPTQASVPPSEFLMLCLLVVCFGRGEPSPRATA